ncbi:MAG: DUF1178 family protein, partial [Candidatus Adiutrix sp.]
MLIYDLTCSQGHHFEGWFKDLPDLNSQIQEKILNCPICNDDLISRKPSTFGLMKRSQNEPAPLAPPLGPKGVPQDKMQHLLRQWAVISEKLEKESENVGTNFAEEALKMHYGVTTRRNIRGISTEAQEVV